MLEPEELGKRRSDLADALRDLRLEKGLTGDRLAARCGISQSKISKIETGRTLPSLADVERILSALDAPDELRQEVYSLARLANTEYQDLRSSLRRGLHHKQKELASYEATSSHIRFFLPAMLTGLLHTPEYARASLASIPGDQSKAVARRLERQAVLYESGKRFSFLLTEQAIRWPMCEPAAMAVQIGRLLALEALPNISLGVIPWTRQQAPDGPLNTFTVYDSRLATVETFTGALLLRDPRDIDFYLDLFATFEPAAIYGQECQRFLTMIRDGFIP
ncbi:helix-turn-helix domain-containing protein [Actinomadura rupiterrae]|uniref:helix-turn-helix domain-containing protein n=1 Tax=Actinomadura rupiterrae TaxID=559627 RepID=UPI0020A477B5|nr:helix-turn-helix transcriptional regulator [Actinomadura rupiterrae]MCP2335790.1 transcriptional regulator with XRE-family HTH domain [Actinomadura rupiterrae]